ncbi:MAG: glucose-1-phosphate thymidylyltransferase RfbA [Fusobacteriaceae bacterium]
MKGIILAGGTGSRLSPVTDVLNKQLIPLYDKPTIYYPLSVLMLADIREILIISSSRDLGLFKKLFGDGERYGISITYKVQEAPNGLAEAFLIGEDFIKDDSVALILGDNFFYGGGFSAVLESASKLKSGGCIFGYYVKNPKEFGVVEFTDSGKVISLEEKPEFPKSNYAVPGIYFYDKSVVEKAKNVKPSDRGELEITSINKMYLEENNLNLISLGRGMAWLDTGTFDGLLEAGNFVKTIQSRQGIMIACLEEVAYLKGWISKSTLLARAAQLSKTSYGQYLFSLV